MVAAAAKLLGSRSWQIHLLHSDTRELGWSEHTGRLEEVVKAMILGLQFSGPAESFHEPLGVELHSGLGLITSRCNVSGLTELTKV